MPWMKASKYCGEVRGVYSFHGMSLHCVSSLMCESAATREPLWAVMLSGDLQLGRDVICRGYRSTENGKLDPSCQTTSQPSLRPTLMRLSRAHLKILFWTLRVIHWSEIISNKRP